MGNGDKRKQAVQADSEGLYMTKHTSDTVINLRTHIYIFIN